jgi:hypothetical protein
VASLAKLPNGKWMVQFHDSEGVRRTIRLPKRDERTAEAVRRHVEHLVAAKLTGYPPSDDVLRWLTGIDDVLRKRLAKGGLVSEARAGVILGGVLKEYTKQRPDVKRGKVIAWTRTRRVLSAYFGASRPMRSITAADARDFERWLHTPEAGVLKHGDEAPSLARATLRRHIGHCRQFWNEALMRGLVQENPLPWHPGTHCGQCCQAAIDFSRRCGTAIGASCSCGLACSHWPSQVRWLSGAQ